MGRRSGPRIARIPGRLALLGIAGTLGLCCTPSAASADTATIGSALTRPSNISAFNEAAVTVQRSQEGVTGSNPLTSPANGLVTEWAVMSRDTNAIYSLRVLRPVGPTSYLVAGSAVAPTPDPGGSNTILRYPASVPIQLGDAIGLTSGGDADAGIPQADTPGITENVIAVSPGAVPDGGTATFAPFEQHELLLQATVTYCNVPAVKKLKTKAAAQALQSHDCGVRKKKSRTKKKKLRGKVLKQKTPPGTTAAPGTVVPIVIGRK